jgi:KUP system potassium uptake protein
MSSPVATERSAPSLALILGVLGVVYGDIGTSPLYAMRAAVSHFEDGGVEAWEVLGLLSLIIWSLILTVTVKYVAFVLRADLGADGACAAQRGKCAVALGLGVDWHCRRLPVLW